VKAPEGGVAPHKGVGPLSDLVVSLGAVGPGDVALVGGKGASLGELVGVGLPVPPGFVVTTEAFHLSLAREDLAEVTAARLARLDPDDHVGVEGATAELRRHLETCLLPAELETAILSHHEALAEPPFGLVPAVAVRSSATGEDSLDASFAGLQDTFLWVPDAARLLARLRSCWSSLYSVEAVCYRLQRRIPEEQAAMAVVVQQMVDARSSGVMFTRSPRSGDRSVVAIESAWGLGSAVVGGDVTPDFFSVSKVTGEILRRQVSRKGRRHVLRPDGDGVLAEEVPGELQGVASLGDEEIGQLVDLARAVEAHFGIAQDIEWAIAKASSMGASPYLLQSRPETAWAKQAHAPIAGPKARAFDHVIDALGRR